MDMLKGAMDKIAILLRGLHRPSYTIKRTHRRIGRNEQCRCGCGKKYKYHLWSDDLKRGIR